MECFARRRSEFKEGSKSQNGNDQQQTAFLVLGSEHGHIVHDEEGEGHGQAVKVKVSGLWEEM